MGTLGGSRTWGSALNDRGQVVGRSCAEPSEGPSCPWHAFLWSNGTITDLGTLGGQTSEARDINNAGYIVGVSQFSPESFETHAVLWRPMTGEAAMRRSSSSTRSR